MSDLQPPERPQLQHGNTSPLLTGYLSAQKARTEEPEQVQSGEDSSVGQALLNDLSRRRNDDYRTIAIHRKYVPNRNFQQHVSFDTIDLQYDAESSDEDEFRADVAAARRRMLNDFDVRGREPDQDRRRIRSPGSSPSTSPQRVMSPHRSVDMARFFSRNQIQYPTTPILTRRCCTLTRTHRDFEDLYAGKLLNRGLCPVLQGRVILVYVSGRKHTWVALDWILRVFVQNGDSIIIVSSIPQPLARGARNAKHPNLRSYPPKTEKVRQRQRHRPEYMKEIVTNIMKYALSVVNPEAIVRVVVEIAEGKTKEVLEDMYKLYEPNLVATGSKSGLRSGAPLKSWNSSRLSDRLVKNFPLPVIVVPAQNMGPFEKNLEAELSETVESSNVSIARSQISHHSRQTHLLSTGDDTDSESLSDASLHSESTTESESSTELYSSFDEIADLYTEYRKDVREHLDQLKNNEIDEQYFANFMRQISDKSLRFCEELGDVNPDFKGKGAILARALTGSNKFGAVPYKTRSMLPPVEPKSNDTTQSPGISVKDLKRALKKNAELQQQNTSRPSILVEAPSEDVTPKASALKFEEGEKPSKRAKSRQLKKFLSYEDPSDRKVNIEPSKSHPDITTVYDTTDKKKRRKKRFLGLF